MCRRRAVTSANARQPRRAPAGRARRVALRRRAPPRARARQGRARAGRARRVDRRAARARRGRRRRRARRRSSRCARARATSRTSSGCGTTRAARGARDGASPDAPFVTQLNALAALQNLALAAHNKRAMWAAPAWRELLVAAARDARADGALARARRALQPRRGRRQPTGDVRRRRDARALVAARGASCRPTRAGAPRGAALAHARRGERARNAGRSRRARWRSSRAREETRRPPRGSARRRAPKPRRRRREPGADGPTPTCQVPSRAPERRARPAREGGLTAGTWLAAPRTSADVERRRPARGRPRGSASRSALRTAPRLLVQVASLSGPATCFHCHLAGSAHDRVTFHQPTSHTFPTTLHTKP